MEHATQICFTTLFQIAIWVMWITELWLIPCRLCPQSITPWTAWCQRPSSASSWRPSAITPCLSLRMSAESAFFKERPSASLWRLRASVAFLASSWSLRCLQGSFRIESWGRPGLKVDCQEFPWISFPLYFYSSLFSSRVRADTDI